MGSSFKVSIMVLGEMGVGKTSLLLRFQKGKFSVYNASTSINRYFKDIHVLNTDVQLELYDTGGHDRFRDFIKANYKKVDGILLVYDVTDVTSFYKLSSWLAEVRSANEKMIVNIVGNKSDSPDVKAISQTMVKSYAFKENLEYYESSAKTGQNVHQLFERMALKILESKNVITSSVNRAESQNVVHPVKSTDSAIIIPSPKSPNIPPELPQRSAESEESSVTPTQSLESSNHPPIQPVTSSDEPAVDPDGSEESDWCFPDLEYLNSRNRNSTVENSPENGDLPPVVPLPDDIIRLHIEKYRNDGKRKNEKRKETCCF